MKKERLTSVHSLGLLLSVGLTWSTSAMCEAETEINRVTLMVQDGAASKPVVALVPGVQPDGTRKHAAYVDASGKVDRQVKCLPQDKFEAHSESKLDLPLPPPRKTCAQVLAFGFSRLFVTEFPSDYVSPLADLKTAPKVYSNYATFFEAKGQAKVANTFKDAARMAIAADLGDKKFDRDLYRDEKKNFALEFTPQGIQALKERQGRVRASKRPARSTWRPSTRMPSQEHRAATSAHLNARFEREALSL